MSLQAFVEPYAHVEADGTAVVSTAAETIIFPNISLPAGYLRAGSIMNLKAFGRLSSVSAATIRFRLRLGGVAGTLIWDSGLITTNSPTNALWKVDIDFVGRASGASGSIFAMGEAVVGSAAAATVASATGAPAVVLGGSAGDDTPAAVTVDLVTAALDVALTATWGASSASNTLTGHLERLTSYR